MTAAGDPLGSGLVASLARPGGNVTGMSLMVPDLGAKRLQLLKEVLPRQPPLREFTAGQQLPSLHGIREFVSAAVSRSAW
jgi:hypothetical protein